MQPVPLAVIAAMDDEIRIIRSRMSVDSCLHLKPAVFVKGTFEQKPLLLVRSGIGRKAMGDAARYMAERYKPDFCLHVGYCGGADPVLAAGDAVIGCPVVDSTTGEKFEPSIEARSRAEKVLKEMGLGYKLAGIVTVDEIAAGPFDKAFLGTQHEAAAIDMESAPLARACVENNVPYIVVRTVLDPLDFEFPDLSGSYDEAGKPDGMALAGRLLRQPSEILKLPKLEYLASQARQSVASVIEAWVRQEAT